MSRKTKIKMLSKSIICGFLITLLLGLCGFSGRCDVIRSSVLRLHILANSDSESDQNLKLLVRDAIQNEAGYIFDEANNIEDATRIAVEEKERFLSIARRVIAEQGYDYPVDLVVTQEYFETRTYDEVTLPAGTYTAVKILIGEGAGKNWWCVLFPCMCLPAAQESAVLSKVLDNEEVKVAQSNPKYEVRFKVVEWFQSITSFFS